MNKYTDFSTEEIINPQYQEIAEHFLEMAPNDEIRKKMESIIFEGGLDDFSVNSGTIYKNNPDRERKRRIGMASLLLSTPETFEVLKSNNISLFHGTNLTALPSILKYGIRSVDDLSSLGEKVSTGEDWSRVNGKRNFISFTDDIDLAIEYSCISLADNTSSFGIVLGISADNVKNLKTITIPSDMIELSIKSPIPLEYIKFIGVPEEHIKFVKKLIGTKSISVMPLNMKNKGYYIDHLGNINYNIDDLKKLSYDRKQSSIKKIFNKLKDNLLRKDSLINEQNTRD